MRELSAAQRVFGVSADHGPYELLGLTPGPVEPAAVRTAAARRLQRLAAGAFDPLDVVAAQEAVAAAEAQLADPKVQREWLRLHAGGAPVPAGTPAAARAAAQIDPWVPAVRAALARAGGWNRRAVVPIATIAAAAHADPVALVRAAARTARPSPRPAPRPRVAPPAPAAQRTTQPAEAAEINAPGIAGPLAAAAAALVFTALVLVGVAVLRTASAPHPAPAEASESPIPSIEPPTPESLDPILATDMTTTASLVEAMSAGVTLLSTKPADAAWRMEEAILAFAARWPEADPAERARALDLTRTFLMDAAPGGGASDRVAAAAAAPLGESPPAPPTPASARAAVWAGGARALLLNDSSLPTEVGEALQAAAPAAGNERTFEGGARAALRTLAVDASRTPDTDPAVWERWVEMLDLLTSGRALARERQALALEALETVLLAPAPPSRSRASLEGVELLLPRAELSGTRAAVARTRLVAWLDDPRIAPIDLAILMRAAQQPELASRELSPSASADARALLRDELLRTWGMSAPASPGERVAERWARTEREVFRMAGATSSERLARSVASARMIGAAALAWEGEAIRAEEALSNAAAITLRSPRAAREHAPPSDGRWTVEYHSQRRNAERAMEAIDRADTTSDMGPIDARTLARLAFLGSPPPVRVRAQEIVSVRAGEINVVEALLEYLPRAPRTPRVGELVELVSGVPVGSPRDDGWMLRARRALVERLLRMLDPDDAPARADALAGLLRDALGGAPSAGVTPPADPAEAIADVTDALFKNAAGLGVASSLDADEARRRRDGRRRVADGPIQRTVAEALALADVLGVLVESERPARASEARAILRDLTLRQRRATDAFDQLDAALGAGVRLWGLRLGHTPAGTASAPGRAPMSVLPMNALPAALSMATLPDRDARLDALDPNDPSSYLRLAEMVAYEAQTPADLALARRLALLAAWLAEADARHARVASSACLLLADLSTDAQRRHWLRALADSFGARDGLLGWRVERTRDYSARLAAAEVLGLVRAEDNRRAGERYENADVRRALGEYAHAIPGGLQMIEHRITHAPSCPECKNERVVRSSSNPNDWVLCHTCRGRLSPVVERSHLVLSLRVERALLGEGDDWSVAIVAQEGAPLRDLTLEEAAEHYGVDLSRPVYRDGRWE